MWNLSTELTGTFAAAGFALLGLIHLLVGWTSRHSWRSVVRGTGTIALATGLWLTGVMNLVVNGTHSLLSWFRGQTFGQQMKIGLGVIALGLVLYIIGDFIPPVSRKDAKRRRADKQARSNVLQPSTGVAPIPGAVPAVPGKNSQLDLDDDSEVTRILNSRGIK